MEGSAVKANYGKSPPTVRSGAGYAGKQWIVDVSSGSSTAVAARRIDWLLSARPHCYRLGQRMSHFHPTSPLLIRSGRSDQDHEPDIDGPVAVRSSHHLTEN